MFVQLPRKKHELRNDTPLHNREAPPKHLAMYTNLIAQ